MIVKYHRDNYVGENIIIVGSGDINHSELVEAVEKNFTVPEKSTTKVELVKPQFCEGMSLLQSNHTNLLNMIVVHEAPSFFDRSFLIYLILQRIVSDRPANPF